MSQLSLPTTARLPPSLRVDPTNITVIKNLSRLSRESLIALALDWLDDSTIANAAPYLAQTDEHGHSLDDPEDLYPPCETVEELREMYSQLQDHRGAKRDVVTRILEGDWRQGLTLYQLAMIDFAHLDEHPHSQKWTAYKIAPLQHPTHGNDDEVLRADEKSLAIPRFHPSTFLQNLQNQVLPDVKAHYHFYRPRDYPVLFLRIFVLDSPYNTQLALSGLNSTGTTNFNSSRTIYLAFPDSAPSLYISKAIAPGNATAGEGRSLQSLIIKGVPQALSRPRERYTLQVTYLTSRNLGALLDKKGAGRGNAAGGGWSVYTDDKDKKSPLDTILPTPPLSRRSSHAITGSKRNLPISKAAYQAKRAKLTAQARFGRSGIISDGKGVERIDILMQDPFPSISPADFDDAASQPPDARGPGRRTGVDAALQEAAEDDGWDPAAVNNPNDWVPNVRITFQGSHVFAGIRQLVEAGIIDGAKMPGWMTGEEGITTGVVRDGRVWGNKGSGL
ncbi:Putative CHL4-domain-containing protein [[Torrubiella] hemipterigena]|uniref:Putative CHL4-domain-containing protein n=1 Tax=[Torrubiella] hemipterigena TaxID=1531966 RepID=A0A0A1T193_9HYPO|nr:Putative CHL4-domain-containing protein [[Torrubiella] hemipterigena]